jgi:hypothetical protein
MEKTIIQQEKESSHQQTEINLKDVTGELLHLEYRFVWCWNLNTSESISEIPEKFWNVVLEKDGEDQLHDRVRSEEGERNVQ